MTIASHWAYRGRAETLQPRCIPHAEHSLRQHSEIEERSRMCRTFVCRGTHLLDPGSALCSYLNLLSNGPGTQRR